MSVAASLSPLQQFSVGTNHNQVSGKDSFFATFAKTKIMSKRGMYDINILNKCLKEVSIT
jgi:hypothetical protein